MANKTELKGKVTIYNMENFDPTPFIQYYEDGTAYLKFMTQVMWFRSVYPNGKIAAFKPVWCEERTPGTYVCTARVYADRNDAMDNFIAEASCMRGAIVVDGTEVSGYTMSHRAAISEALKLAGFWVPLSEADYTAEPTAAGDEGLADKSDADASEAISTETAPAPTTPATTGKKRGRKTKEEKAAEAAAQNAETPAAEETPVVEEPVVEAPAVEETPVVEEPVVEAPAVEETPVVEAEQHEYSEEEYQEALKHEINHRGYNNTVAALVEEAKTENDKRSYLNWFAFSPLAMRTMPESAKAAKVALDYNKELVQNLY
jgi:hypothetical protein